MSSEIKRRAEHGVFYANVTYMSIRLRDCLKTVDRDEAQRRIIELKLLPYAEVDLHLLEVQLSCSNALHKANNYFVGSELGQPRIPIDTSQKESQNPGHETSPTEKPK